MLKCSLNSNLLEAVLLKKFQIHTGCSMTYSSVQFCLLMSKIDRNFYSESVLWNVFYYTEKAENTSENAAILAF